MTRSECDMEEKGRLFDRNATSRARVVPTNIPTHRFVVVFNLNTFEPLIPSAMNCWVVAVNALSVRLMSLANKKQGGQAGMLTCTRRRKRLL